MQGSSAIASRYGAVTQSLDIGVDLHENWMSIGATQYYRINIARDCLTSPQRGVRYKDWIFTTGVVYPNRSYGSCSLPDHYSIIRTEIGKVPWGARNGSTYFPVGSSYWTRVVDIAYWKEGETLTAYVGEELWQSTMVPDFRINCVYSGNGETWGGTQTLINTGGSFFYKDISPVSDGRLYTYGVPGRSFYNAFQHDRHAVYQIRKQGSSWVFSRVFSVAKSQSGSLTYRYIPTPDRSTKRRTVRSDAPRSVASISRDGRDFVLLGDMGSHSFWGVDVYETDGVNVFFQESLFAKDQKMVGICSFAIGTKTAQNRHWGIEQVDVSRGSCFDFVSYINNVSVKRSKKERGDEYEGSVFYDTCSSASVLKMRNGNFTFPVYSTVPETGYEVDSFLYGYKLPEFTVIAGNTSDHLEFVTFLVHDTTYSSFPGANVDYIYSKGRASNVGVSLGAFMLSYSNTDNRRVSLSLGNYGV
jgi:hypothetical protein